MSFTVDCAVLSNIFEQIFALRRIGLGLSVQGMEEAKNTARAVVHIGYDGLVYKTFKGPQARERYENEVRVLKFLDKHKCGFVPKIVESDDAALYLVTTNCGKRVDRMSDTKKEQIFAELEQYGVRHDDAEVRNITYSTQLGRFCVIDFEFATILEPGYPPSPKMKSVADRSQWKEGSGDA
jgi:hypothetical protein